MSDHPSEESYEAAAGRLDRALSRLEASVRSLNGRMRTHARIEADNIIELLDHPRFGYRTEIEERMDTPGVAVGLAVTAVGGDVLFVEAAQMPGKGNFQYTGQLGQVMQESARAAYSYIRAKAQDLNVDPSFFEMHDIHLHVPAGAVPKDGPSAGVTMATALASLITQRPVRNRVAMTGEVTLRGQVLPVGGIKDKVLAAHRAGLTTVILPHRNEHDLDDVPQEVRDQMAFHLVDSVTDVLEAALVPADEAEHEPALAAEQGD